MPSSGTCGSDGSSPSGFVTSLHPVLRVALPTCVSPSGLGGSPFLHAVCRTFSLDIFDDGSSDRHQGGTLLEFRFVFLWSVLRVEHLFVCFLAVCVFFGEMSIQICPFFKIWGGGAVDIELHELFVLFWSHGLLDSRG